MDAGNRYNAASRFPPSILTHQRKKSLDDLDRFIPNRSAMDFDYAHFMLMGGKVVKESPSPCSPFNDAYRKQLAEVFNKNRTRILAFKNKPPPSVDCFQEPFSTVPNLQPSKSRRCIPQSAERVLDAPEILDDYYLNLLDWGSNNILAIGLGNSVYLWDASNGSTTELLAVDGNLGPVTSVRWAPDGKHIAVGLDNSNIQLWDSVAIRLSPDGYTVASAAADETLRIWNVFGTPDLTKPAPEPKSMPFTHLAHIR